MTTTAPAVTALPIPSFMQAAQEPEEVGPPKSFLLYGDTGTQKTLSLGKLVKAGFFKRVLYINIDNGEEVLALDPEVRAAFKDGRITNQVIDPFDPNAMAKIEAIVLEVVGKWRDPQGTIQDNPSIPNFGFDLVFLDTVNLIHEVALKYLQRTTYNDKGTALDGLKAYAKISVWADEMIRLIHNSPRFTGGFVMHEKTFEEKTGGMKIKPKMSGSFKDTIATIPSIVAHLDYEENPATKEVQLTATVGESTLYSSKNRYNLGPKIYGFDIVEMYKEIYARIGKELPAPAPRVDAAPVVAPAATTTNAATAA
jgi:hypothetical protein